MVCRSPTAGMNHIGLLLKGIVPSVPDWSAVLGLANHLLLTPAIWAAVTATRADRRLPKEVAAFLSYIHSCNDARNRRLYFQLVEVVAALNRSAIEPTLTKG